MASSEFEPNFEVTGKRTWQNWHEYQYSVEELINVWNGQPADSTVNGYKATTKGFQNTIARALADGTTIRAAGGGWSLSSVAATGGILLNTRPLNYRFAIRNSHVRSSCRFAGNADNLKLVQCGNSVAGLHRYLNRDGKSLKTCGASNGQTIAGALATGTHGSAFDVGAVQDYVVALHIVVSPQRSVWIERASDPVFKSGFPKFIGVPSADIIRDDAIFNAALVSFGSFGIIHGVVIEATDLFFLQSYRELKPLDEGMWKAAEHLDFSAIELPHGSERPYHFQLVLNPFDVESGVYRTVMYQSTNRPADCQPAPQSGIGLGDSALEIAAAITQIASPLTPALATVLFNQLSSSYSGVCGTLGEIFKDTSVRGKAASTGIGIPLGRVREAFEITQKQIVEDKVPLVVALRYVRASAATLAFTSHSPHTCVLELDGPRSRNVLDSYRRIWRGLKDAGIPITYHWGKINSLHLDSNEVREIYGERVTAWLDARRSLLTTPKLRAVFANEFLVKAGLAVANAG